MTFDEYLAERGAWLPRFARVLCGHRELAEDVLQEVLLRVHGRWAKIGSLDHPDAHIRRMIVNEHLNWRRRSARLVPHAEVEPAAVTPDHAERSADHAQLSALMLGLTRKQRTAVVLRYYSDLSDQDIAETMGCSTGTVRSHLSRALAAMRVDLRAQTLESKKG